LAGLIDAFANYHLQPLEGDSIQAVYFKPGELLSEEGPVLNWVFLVEEVVLKLIERAQPR